MNLRILQISAKSEVDKHLVENLKNLINMFTLFGTLLVHGHKSLNTGRMPESKAAGWKKTIAADFRRCRRHLTQIHPRLTGPLHDNIMAKDVSGGMTCRGLPLVYELRSSIRRFEKTCGFEVVVFAALDL